MEMDRPEEKEEGTCFESHHRSPPLPYRLLFSFCGACALTETHLFFPGYVPVSLQVAVSPVPVEIL